MLEGFAKCWRGMDIEGGMVIGGRASDIKLDDDIDLGDWAYENGMEPMSPWYDSGPENWVIGFKVDDIEVDKTKKGMYNGIGYLDPAKQRNNHVSVVVSGLSEICPLWWK